MITNKQQYYLWIQQRGVGLKDIVASSPDSYISYLNSVSNLLGEDISPAILSTEEDVMRIANQLEHRQAPGTIRNYKSAMRQYVSMVQAQSMNLAAVNAHRIEIELNSLDSLRSPDLSATTEHSLLSSYREVLLEHLFAGEVMRHLWLRGNKRMETLKPQVDDGGYDLVLEANGVVRHVQLKSSHADSSTAGVNVNLHLAKKPSGCVIWLWFDPITLKLGPYLWFGSTPGNPLPDVTELRIAKHAKGNAQGVKLLRPNLRIIPKGRFESIVTVEELVLRLFGTFRDL